MARILSLLPGGGALFRRVVAANRRAASPAPVPGAIQQRARAFAAANPADGTIILGALDREPRFHRGGWILRLQPRAAAMTLDRDVFLRQDLSARRYVHELVHVHQYDRHGPVRFLEVYAGGAVRTLAARILRRRPLDPMTASPLETETYAIDRHFTAWEAQQP